MKTQGKLLSIKRNLDGGNKFLLTFVVDDIENWESLYDKPLVVQATKYSEKRSLTANSYFHVLVGKLAEALCVSKAYMKNIQIAKYGQQLYIDEQPQFVKTQIEPKIMYEYEHIHTGLVKVFENAYMYKVLRGSSTYNTHEMSKLIDGTVSDCKELGIETLTPRELEMLKREWK